MTEYKVIGTRGYRGYQPGEFFEAKLAPDVEARGINRGNIRVIHPDPPALQPGTYTLPQGWLNQNREEGVTSG